MTTHLPTDDCSCAFCKPQIGQTGATMQELKPLKELARKLKYALTEPIGNWLVDGKSIVNASDNAPLLHDRAAHPQSLALVAEALNFVVRRKMLTEIDHELESLIAAIETAFAELRGRFVLADRLRVQYEDEIEELEAEIADERAKELEARGHVIAANEQLRAEVANWKDIAKQAHGVTEEQRAEIAALKTLGPCGIHPMACWVEGAASYMDLLQANPNVLAAPGGHCTACVQQEKTVRLALEQAQCHPAACRDEMKWREQVQLERAAALRQAQADSMAVEGTPYQVWEAIEAILSDSDRSALDAFKAEVLREPRRLIAEVYGEFVSRHYIPANPMPADGSADTRWMKEAEEWLRGSKS